MTQSQSLNGVAPGLDNVVAAETRLSRPDGQKGELIIAGYAVEELAGRATFEEVVYLLWHGARPTPAQLETFGAELAALRNVPAAALDLLAA
ncbi:MAG: citrate synthase, partial [Caldilineaceae bacterium]|nr:citrate synthase [Caldilineaceae bacterium]